MNTNEYVNKVDYMLQIYKLLKQHPNDLDGTKHLYYAINNIRQMVINMEKVQGQNTITELSKKISEIQTAGIAADRRLLDIYNTALAYVYYYTTCPIDYYLSSDRPGQEFLFNTIFGSSDYNIGFIDDTYDFEQQYYVKTLLIGLEAEALKMRAIEKSGAERLVLYGFNEKIICENLVTPIYAQIAICGPITKNQNESFNYYKYNLKNKDGERYGGGLGTDYDSYAYNQLASNCIAANKLYNKLLTAFSKIKDNNQFKGCFYTFTGQDLQKFASLGASWCKHQLQEVKGSQFINNEQCKALINSKK